MTCCRCKRYGSCVNCKCSKEGQACRECQPNQLGSCQNPFNKDPNALSQKDSSRVTTNEVPDQPQTIDKETTVCSDTLIPERTDSFDFRWGKLNGEEFYDVVSDIYERVVHWKRNIFMIPSGNVGKSFVNHLATLYQSYADESPMECIALKAATVFQILLLQKPGPKSRSKDHIKHLKRRLDMWINGDIEEIFLEGCFLQERMPQRTSKDNFGEIARKFSKLMSMGKTKSALNYLSRNTTGGILSLDDIIQLTPGSDPISVREILETQHPPSTDPNPEALIQDDTLTQPFHSIIFDNLDGDATKRASIHCQGAAGISGLDSTAWRRLCCSFQQASRDLCNSLASLGRRICTQSVPPDGISAFVACRLIALDKTPGVRPIGIGEVSRRIIAKAVTQIVKSDIAKSTGPLQTCAGLDGGCEAATHAMQEIFSKADIHGVLLVDASNAFNKLNRRTAIHNIKKLCPSIATILSNTYQTPIRMFMQGGGEILSKEGTTQGDPLGMAMYALATMPLIHHLHDNLPDVAQVWFADDSTASAESNSLRNWWDKLQKEGPKYGYHPNEKKTFLIVKPEHYERAMQAFDGTQVNITTHGKRHLGAAIGSKDFITEFVGQKVQQWILELEFLSKIADTQPHAAFSAFIHGLSAKWNYISRTIPNISHLLQPLEDAIKHTFIPSITKRPPCSNLERNILALPPRLGGMGITNPVSNTQYEYESSRKVTSSLTQQIIQQDVNQSLSHDTSKIKSLVRRTKQERQKEDFESIHSQLPPVKQRLLECASERGTSAWLTALPIEQHGFFLHKAAFRDAVHLRYGWDLPGIPNKCSCGATFTVDHAMICAKGGYTILRHNEIRDITTSLLSEVCRNTSTEPLLQPLSGESLQHASAIKGDEARADIKATGFWARGQEAFFDVRVFYPNASSYINRNLASLYKHHETTKKREYGQRIREIEHGTFTPLIFSTTGGMSPETTTFFKKLASDIAQKQHLEYSMVLGWMRCRLSFALLRSAIMAIRGSRSTDNSAKIDILLAANEGGVPRLQ